tara:strand:+ start:1778 stop:2107 length:330 start_codon:yes stop_codon:yes gene_type:complete
MKNTIMKTQIKTQLKNKYKTYFFYINDTKYIKFKIDGGMFGGDYLWFESKCKYDLWNSHGHPLSKYTENGRLLDLEDDIIYWIHNTSFDTRQKKELKKFLKETFNIKTK